MGFRGRGTILIATAAPTESVDVGDSFVTGGTGLAADAGHQHAVPAPAPGDTQDLAAVGAEGSSTAPARANHRHRHRAVDHSPGGFADLSVWYELLGAIAVNVADYGAVPGVTATAEVQAAANAAAAGCGVLFFPLSHDWRFGQITAPNPLIVLGGGPDTVIRCAGLGPATPAGVVPWWKLGTPSGNGHFQFCNLTMDASLSDPLWAAAADTDNYLIAIDARNFGSSNNAIGKLTVRDVVFTDWAIANKHGCAVNTFAIPDYVFSGVTFDNCDMGAHVTEPFITSPVTGHMSDITAHDCALAAVFFEGFGYCDITNFSADSTGGTPSQGDGIIIWTSNETERITVDNGRFNNLRYPLNIGFGGTHKLKNSSFSNLIATGCRGSFGLFQADSSCTFTDLIADGCAIGGISGATCFGSIEVGVQAAASAGDFIRLANPTVVNSANNAIACGIPVRILGGLAANWTGSAVYFNPGAPAGAAANKAASRIRHLGGYNPQGSAAITVTASPFTYTNNDGVDEFVSVYGGTTTQVAKDGVAITTASPAFFHLAPQEQVTVTYSAGAPAMTKDLK